MAIPLNTFKSSSATLVADKLGGFTGDSDLVYQTPNGITSIVLMAQAANIDSEQSHYVTLSYFDNSLSVTNELVKNFEVQPNDAAGLLTGKLIVEEGNKILCTVKDASSVGKVKFTFSYLESLNG
tara:strand:- start:4034 stop:4408 length:375 start_codon:yes stop_codon:yes gene_type:complete